MYKIASIASTDPVIRPQDSKYASEYLMYKNDLDFCFQLSLRIPRLIRDACIRQVDLDIKGILGVDFSDAIVVFDEVELGEGEQSLTELFRDKGAELDLPAVASRLAIALLDSSFTACAEVAVDLANRILATDLQPLHRHVASIAAALDEKGHADAASLVRARCVDTPSSSRLETPRG